MKIQPQSRGASGLQYSLFLGLVAVLALGAIADGGKSVRTVFCRTAAAIGAGTCDFISGGGEDDETAGGTGGEGAPPESEVVINDLAMELELVEPLPALPLLNGIALHEIPAFVFMVEPEPPFPDLPESTAAGDAEAALFLIEPQPPYPPAPPVTAIGNAAAALWLVEPEPPVPPAPVSVAVENETASLWLVEPEPS
jgi:hypothetical protein